MGITPGFYVAVNVDGLACRPRLVVEIRDLATFENPNQLSEGMEFVLVNGVPVIEGGKMTNALPGKVLRGQGYQ